MPFIVDDNGTSPVAGAPHEDCFVTSGTIDGPKTEKFSTMDQFSARRYEARVLVFKADTSDPAKNRKIFEDIRTGLSTALKAIPHLQGRIAYDNKQRATLHMLLDKDTGFPLSFRDYSQLSGDAWPYPSFDELQKTDFDMAAIPRELLRHPWNTKMNPKDHPAPSIAQVNIIKGGVILTSESYHTAIDGNTWDSLFKAWAPNVARASRNEPLEVLEIPQECFDNTAMSKGPEGPAAKEMLMKKMKGAKEGKDKGDDSKEEQSQFHTHEKEVDVHEAVFQLTEAKAAELKKAASPENPDDGFISTNDAVCALLWIHTTRIRKAFDPSLEKTKFTLAASLRGKLPGVPQGYIGNAVNRIHVEAPVDELLVESPQTLRHTAMKIRKAVQNMDVKSVKVTIAVGNHMPSFAKLAKHEHEPKTCILSSTNRSSMVVYKQDWGAELGYVQRWRLFDMAENSRSVLLPKTQEGNFEVVVALEKESIEALKKDKEFTDYATLSFSERLAPGELGRKWEVE